MEKKEKKRGRNPDLELAYLFMTGMGFLLIFVVILYIWISSLFT